MKHEHASIVNFFRVASLLMLLVAVALLAAITTMHFAIHGAEVQVPALKGMTVADARSETAGLGLNLDVDNRYYSGDVAAGHILTQSPAPGTVVRREWRVRVAESLGPQRWTCPIPWARRSAWPRSSCGAPALKWATPRSCPDAAAAEGTVLAQDPPAHAQDIAQPSVSLLVAAPDDEAPDGYVMPDLTGLPVVTAQAELAKVGIKTRDAESMSTWPMRRLAAAMRRRSRLSGRARCCAIAAGRLRAWIKTPRSSSPWRSKSRKGDNSRWDSAKIWNASRCRSANCACRASMRRWRGSWARACAPWLRARPDAGDRCAPLRPAAVLCRA